MMVGGSDLSRPFSTEVHRWWIEFGVVYFQHNTYYIQQCFFCKRRVEKEASRRQSSCGLFPYHIYKDMSYHTQLGRLLIGDNDFNNHNDYCSCNIIAKLLQTYENKE